MLGGGERSVGGRWRFLVAVGLAVASVAAGQSRAPEAASGRAEAAGIAPGDAGSGALLVRPRPEAGWQPAPEVSTAVEIGVVGLVARARVEQLFANPSAERVEALYLFPLPEGAAVDRFELEVDGRRIVGRVKEKEAARRTYEQARDQGRRASLLEQSRPNLFRIAVAGIDPGASVTVRIEYQELVRFDAGDFRLRFPLTVGPRFTPPIPFERPAGEEPPPAVVTLLPGAPPADPAAARPVRLRATIEAGLPLERLESPTHPLRVARRPGGGWTAELAAGVVPADRDLELVWRPRRSAMPRVARFEEEVAGERYAALLLLPPSPGFAGGRSGRDLVLVLDTSGSMDGTSIVQAKRAVRLALERLEPHDRFDLVHFSDSAAALFGSPVPADARALEIARVWLERLPAHGGTNIAAGLELALGAPADDRGALRQVLLVTDGCVGNEEELFDRLRATVGASRLFTVAIGSAPNSFFLTRAAELGRGTHTHIGRIEEVEARMTALFAKLESPVLTDLELAWDDPAAETYPARPPDLYLGEPLLVLAKLDRPGAGVVLRGRRVGAGPADGDEPFEHAAAAGSPKPAAGLARLWARRKIDALEAAAREPGADAESLRGEIVELAIGHSLASRHTSFVAVEERPSAAGPPDATRSVASLLPAGWTLGAELPQGGAGATRLLGLALAAAFAALLLHRIGHESARHESVRREREP